MSILEAITGAPNASQPLPWLLSSGQPTEADLREAAARGVTAVIDLRDPMEQRPFDEPALLAELGVEYINIPVVSGDLDDETMERILAALREHAGSSTLLHCASANRVGGPLIAWLMLEQGMSEEAAVEAAMRAGLRSAELLEWGVGYVRSRQG